MTEEGVEWKKKKREAKVARAPSPVVDTSQGAPSELRSRVLASHTVVSLAANATRRRRGGGNVLVSVAFIFIFIFFTPVFFASKK